MKEFDFYLMARGWLDHPAFDGEPLSKHAAWIWMIEAAAHKEHTISVLGRPLKLDRGQFSHSIRFMSERFKWEHKKVARFIDHLEKWGFVGTATPHGQTVITICNYNKYQLGKNGSGTGCGTAAGQQRDKEERNNNKDNINIISTKEAKPELGLMAPDKNGAAWPDWVPAEALAGFIANRKAMKAAMTPRAIELLIKKLAEYEAQGHSPAELLNTAVMNGWKSVYPPKGENHGNQSANASSRRPTAQESLFEGFDIASHDPYFQRQG